MRYSILYDEREFWNYDLEEGRIFMNIIMRNELYHYALTKPAMMFLYIIKESNEETSSNENCILVLNPTKEMIIKVLSSCPAVYTPDSKKIFFSIDGEGVYTQLFDLSLYDNLKFNYLDYEDKFYIDNRCFDDYTNLNSLYNIIQANYNFFDKYVRNRINKYEYKYFLSETYPKTFYFIEKNKIDFVENIFPSECFYYNNGYYLTYDLTNNRPFLKLGDKYIYNKVGSKKIDNVYREKDRVIFSVDLHAFFPYLAAEMLNYDMKDIDPYKLMDKKDFLKYMFSEKEHFPNIEYFELYYKFRNNLYEEFKSKGYIECVTGRRIYDEGNIHKGSLMSRLLMEMETYINVNSVMEILNLTKKYDFYILFYLFDEIFINVERKDLYNCLNEVTKIFSKEKYRFKVKMYELKWSELYL